MGATRARRAELDAACELFLQRLTGPGDFLSGARRAAIAREAARAAECPPDVGFRQGGGPELLQRVEGLGLECTGSGALGCVVYCVSNLQELLDAEWYESAAQKLSAELSALGEFHGEHDERVACLSELVAVVAGVVGVRKFYTAIGERMPPLPPATEGQPLFRCVSEFCCGGLGRTSYAWGFQVMKSQIVATGLEKVGQSPSEWAAFTNPMNPFSKLTPAPLSMLHQLAWQEAMYVPLADVRNMSAPVPSGRSLGRSDVELTAATYAGAVHCSF
ncbi:unnamed protein product [Prorocentrum cordatum]|uniref:Uncharacterized protein n=1 Tax=Prorocentrum cordatum TaxID=2364126 RepID=A0ABN9U1T9_9DINO|nr:unnamed protein product [Polarella glacialis]